VSHILGFLDQQKALKWQARADKAEGRAALAQGYADEEAQRRMARQLLGEQAASIAQNGGSVGSEGLIRQSGANAELDALNIRYGARMKALGFLSSAAMAKSQTKGPGVYLRAGGALLRDADSFSSSKARAG
jgi:hypothetical protein